MPTPRLVGAVWRTSSRSNWQHACVEVAVGPGQVGVRDSKDRSGPALIFSCSAWWVFLRQLQVGG